MEGYRTSRLTLCNCWVTGGMILEMPPKMPPGRPPQSSPLPRTVLEKRLSNAVATRSAQVGRCRQRALYLARSPWEGADGRRRTGPQCPSARRPRVAANYAALHQAEAGESCQSSTPSRMTYDVTRPTTSGVISSMTRWRAISSAPSAQLPSHEILNRLGGESTSALRACTVTTTPLIGGFRP